MLTLDNGHKVSIIADDFIYIEDSRNGSSITNSAEEIVIELENKVHEGLKNRRIFYRDTMGNIDEIKTKYGLFLGFEAGTGDPILARIASKLS